MVCQQEGQSNRVWESVWVKSAKNRDYLGGERGAHGPTVIGVSKTRKVRKLKTRGEVRGSSNSRVISQAEKAR